MTHPTCSSHASLSKVYCPLGLGRDSLGGEVVTAVDDVAFPVPRFESRAVAQKLKGWSISNLLFYSLAMLEKFGTKR